MKTIILTLATILFINLNTIASGNYKSIRMIDNLGRQFNIEIKIEYIEEVFNFDTKKVFEENKKTYELIDIRPFIKPEKEIDEELPF